MFISSVHLYVCVCVCWLCHLVSSYVFLVLTNMCFLLIPGAITLMWLSLQQQPFVPNVIQQYANMCNSIIMYLCFQVFSFIMNSSFLLNKLSFDTGTIIYKCYTGCLNFKQLLIQMNTSELCMSHCIVFHNTMISCLFVIKYISHMLVSSVVNCLTLNYFVESSNAGDILITSSITQQLIYRFVIFYCDCRDVMANEIERYDCHVAIMTCIKCVV